MRILVRSGESDATAVVEVDEGSGQAELISGEGRDLVAAVETADSLAGGSPIWGMVVESLEDWAFATGNKLEYDRPEIPNDPEVVY